LSTFFAEHGNDVQFFVLMMDLATPIFAHFVNYFVFDFLALNPLKQVIHYFSDVFHNFFSILIQNFISL